MLGASCSTSSVLSRAVVVLSAVLAVLCSSHLARQSDTLRKDDELQRLSQGRSPHGLSENVCLHFFIDCFTLYTGHNCANEVKHQFSQFQCIVVHIRILIDKFYWTSENRIIGMQMQQLVCVVDNNLSIVLAFISSLANWADFSFIVISCCSKCLYISSLCLFFTYQYILAVRTSKHYNVGRFISLFHCWFLLNWVLFLTGLCIYQDWKNEICLGSWEKTSKDQFTFAKTLHESV